MIKFSIGYPPDPMESVTQYKPTLLGCLARCGPLRKGQRPESNCYSLGSYINVFYSTHIYLHLSTPSFLNIVVVVDLSFVPTCTYLALRTVPISISIWYIKFDILGGLGFKVKLHAKAQVSKRVLW